MSPANGGVAVADNGSLSGSAWGEGLGWIDFSNVSIDATGLFVGTATGDQVGTINFNCANCSVRTDYRAVDFRDIEEEASDESSDNDGDGSSDRERVSSTALGNPIFSDTGTQTNNEVSTGGD
ncbi:MAG: hypothetical protein WDN67_02795 [Candidatus Moraniibacteriota bacterium]